MNWFRQNRLLGALLIAFGICMVITMILLYSTGSKLATARGEFDKATAERARLETLDPFPNDANYHKLKDYIANYHVMLDKLDRKSTRLNSSHTVISYAVFCLKKKKKKKHNT